MKEIDFDVELIRTNKRHILVKVVLEGKFTITSNINSYTDITDKELEMETRVACRRAMELKLGGVRLIFKEIIKETKNKWIVRTKTLSV